ncbi:sensor histidine kinase [Anaerovorax sp. IOR16]|uniref:sensor histidine kinase n=1 Tax=Anaerovorax sp. IOR16 TaxID=2773458 RepID=UPI0019D13427|nr:HAMP domain-containing sensor histidine kinase [Anaerovorax sp. IOR16]
MDTKLKNLGHNPLGKVIAFLLCVTFFITTIVSSMAAILLIDQQDGLYYGEPFDVLSSQNYMESNALELDFYNKTTEIFSTLHWLENEENIKNGNTINQNEFDNAKRDLFYNIFYEKYQNRYYSEEYDAMVAEDENDTIVLEYENANARKLFETICSSEIETLKNSLIEKDLREYRNSLSFLNKTDGFYYYAIDGNNIFTNLQEKTYSSKNDLLKFFQNKYAYRIYQDGEYFSYPETGRAQLYWENELENFLRNNYNENISIYMAYDTTYIEQQSKLFQDIRNRLIKDISIILFSFLMTVVLFVYLLVTTGKKNEEGSIILCKVDRWFTEIQLAIITAILFLGGAFVFATFREFYNLEYYGNFYSPVMLFFYVGAYLIASIGLFFVLSLVRKIKANRFLADFILWRIVQTVFITFKELYHGSNTIRKVAFVLIVMCVCSASIVMLPVVLIIALLYCTKIVKQYEAIKKGVDEVKNGNLTYKINIKGNGLGEFEQLARDINDISEGFDVAVKQELKNQRLKTELISNVSHDIKTPLTSIITYVDLLKKEGLDSEDAPKYLEVLDQKSIRLKKLTEDLFEAAKASSGDMPVNMHEVELLSLINQGLGEMNDRFQQRGLEVIIKAEKEKYYVLADGQLLWRVVENLFGNIIKYAQQNSRVYIDLREEMEEGSSNTAVLEIKNVSENPLNIPAEELLERFKRGDISRSTEGSGLGLSIAKDLMQIQKAKFDIVVDGDLFKAILTLDTAAKESETESEN